MSAILYKETVPAGNRDLTAHLIGRWSAMADRTCNVDGCSGLHAAKGMCSKHYQRVLHTGITDIITTRPCEGCGAEVQQPARGRTKFCGVECKRATYKKRYGWERTEIACVMCGEMFMPFNSRARYCGAGCRTRGRQVTYLYNLTVETYLEMVAAQNGMCAIDGCDRTNLCIDHDHKCCPTGARSCGSCVRGLLCTSHNFILGILQDDTTQLKSMITYLEGNPSGR